MTFVYTARTARDQNVREYQTRDVVDRAVTEPKALCVRCGHPKWAHCSVRRSLERREVLFVAKVRGEYIWQRHCGGYTAAVSAYRPVICRHSTEGQPDFPCCNSSACAVRDCRCNAFVSPYKKVRAKKATTATRERKKKKVIEQAELFEAVADMVRT